MLAILAHFSAAFCVQRSGTAESNDGACSRPRISSQILPVHSSLSPASLQARAVITQVMHVCLSEACRVNVTLQQFADAALQKEKLSNENKTPGPKEPKLSVWKSFARSLSRTSAKADLPELARTLPAEPDTTDVFEVEQECDGGDTGASHARSENTTDGPQVALPNSEVEMCLAEEATNEIAEGTVMHDMRWTQADSQTDRYTVYHSCIYLLNNVPSLPPPSHMTVHQSQTHGH